MFCTQCGSTLADSDKFCSRCGYGTSQRDRSDDINKSNFTNDKSIEREEIIYLLSGVVVYFSGKDWKIIDEGFCNEVGSKNISNVRSDFVITDKKVIITPAVKDKSGIMLLALLFGGGAIGGAAAGAFSAVADAINQKSKRSLDITGESAKEALLRSVVWDRAELKLEILEESEFDLYGGEWTTVTRFSGPCRYKNSSIEATMSIDHAGRIKNLPLRQKAETAIDVARILEFDLSKIVKTSPWKELFGNKNK